MTEEEVKNYFKANNDSDIYAFCEKVLLGKNMDLMSFCLSEAGHRGKYAIVQQRFLRRMLKLYQQGERCSRKAYYSSIHIPTFSKIYLKKHSVNHPLLNYHKAIALKDVRSLLELRRENSPLLYRFLRSDSLLSVNERNYYIKRLALESIRPVKREILSQQITSLRNNIEFIASFCILYDRDYKKSFLKNPYSTMRNRIQNRHLKPLTKNFIEDYAKQFPKSRTAKIVKEFFGEDELHLDELPFAMW